MIKQKLPYKQGAAYKMSAVLLIDGYCSLFVSSKSSPMPSSSQAGLMMSIIFWVVSVVQKWSLMMVSTKNDPKDAIVETKDNAVNPF